MIGKIRLKPSNCRQGETKLGKLRQKKVMVHSVKSFEDVKKHNPDELSFVQSLVPVIQAVKKKRLGRMLGPKSRLIREEKVIFMR